MNLVTRAIAAIPRPPVATFGAAVIASILNAAVICVIALMPWPETAALARIDALKWLGLAQTALTAIVVISWAWGRPDNLSIHVGGQQVDLGFSAKPEDPPPPE